MISLICQGVTPCSLRYFLSTTVVLGSFAIDLGWRNEVCHPLAAAGDDDAFSALDVVENAQEVGLGFGCLNCPHKLTG